MKIDNIREIIFCNKNGKPTAFAKDYTNHFTEISINEGIKLAKTIDFRILKNREEIAKLQSEVISSNSPKSAGLVYKGAAFATAGVLVLALTGAAGLGNGQANLSDTGATRVHGTVAYAQDNEPTAEEVKETETQEPEVQEESFDSLLEASESQKQQQVVQMMSNYIDYFNGDFADYYKETVQLRDKEGNLTGETIEVKPALLWNYEVPALTIAYNDYTTRELQEIFNGTELDAYTLDANYKNGTLQLFGAYVISDREHPVNLSALIESPEGKAFVEKYENLFYNIKEAKTEEEKIAAVNAFYAELYRDFPIDNDIREVGISHAGGRSLIIDQPYKLAITPMVTATEVMYQNLAIDHTLSDKAIAYFNDLGLCNLAYNSFEKAQRALEDAKYDERYADYEKLSQLKINALKQAGKYVIDDAHRDLSLLTIFQENVNGHFEVMDGVWVYTGGSAILSTTVETYQEIVDQWSESTTRTWTETERTETSDRNKAIDKAGKEKVEEAERKVDEQIEEDNNKAREEAEKQADQEQQRQQAEEDKHAEEVKEEVKQDDQDMQQKIDEANDKIDNGQTVNENDFGDHDVDFDDQHSDENGNLDNSVEDITTDGTGAVDADEPLPDPNVTGKQFDERNRSSLQSTQSQTTTYEADDYTEVIETVEQAAPQVVEESAPVQQESTPVVEESAPAQQEVQNTTPVVEDTTPVVEESTPVVEDTAPVADPEPVVNSEPVQDVTSTYEDEEAVYYDFEDIDYEEEYVSSDEELVDAYVESLANEPSSENVKTK